MSKDINISYKFSNDSLFQEAITHSSYSYENNLEYSYERLEFLGDAVLELIVSEYIMNTYKELDEGVLTRLRAYVVNEKFLSCVADDLNLSDIILLGKGENSATINITNSILADVVEAIIAAIYLDGGYDKAREFIIPLLKGGIELAAKGNLFIDVKGELQRLTQKIFKKMPIYTIVEETGLDHEKTFKVKVEVVDEIFAFGVAKNKRDAEKQAAKTVLSILKVYE